MTKRLLLHLVFAAVLAAVPIAFASTVAYARDGEHETSSVRQRELETKTETENTAEDERMAETSELNVAQQERKERFEANKLRVCEKRQDQLKHMIERVSSRGAKQLEVFKKIADKTKQFYADKGYSATGYNTLVAEVDAAYESASAAVNSTTTTGTSWSCTGDNPKQAMADFKEAKKNEITQLKAYKEKVRSLILLVKKAAGVSSDNTTEGTQ
jgi:hypothetical protein